MPNDRAVPSQATRRTPIGLEQRVLARCRALASTPGTTVVVGFSGGADSLALAAVLGRVAAPAGWRPVLVHVDHGLRAGSATEQGGAAALAAALGLPFQGLRVPGDVRVLHPGVGVEEAARRERYRALAGAASAAGAALLALAHHQQDQAETTLLHLLRGAGPSGAAGMAERTELSIPWWPGATDEAATRLVLWRPFLAEPRAVVREYAAGLGLAPVEDPSNQDLGLRRNALRHEALPTLERVVPGATAALARYARLAADDDAALAAVSDVAYERSLTAAATLRRAGLAEETVAVRRRVVRRWLAEQTGSRSLTLDRTEAVLGLLEGGGRGRRIEIGEGRAVLADGEVLRVGWPTPVSEGEERP